jgi:hypothetical protein
MFRKPKLYCVIVPAENIEYNEMSATLLGGCEAARQSPSKFFSLKGEGKGEGETIFPSCQPRVAHFAFQYLTPDFIQYQCKV